MGKLIHGNRRRHGHADSRSGKDSRIKPSPTYISWRAMHQRCKRQSPVYRGVAVCSRWNSFDNFLADMGVRPAGHTIDRKDNSKGYSPENCRWANKYTQARNRSGVLGIPEVWAIKRGLEAGCKGKDLAEAYGVSRATISMINTGKTWQNVGQ